MLNLKIKISLIITILLGTIMLPVVSVAAADTCPAGQQMSPSTGKCEVVKRKIDCPSGRLNPSDPTQCDPLGNDCNGKTADTCLKKNPIVVRLNSILKVLSALVGIVIVGVIIVGGIQYSLAGDNSNATGAAKQRIMNGFIALAAFLFAFALLNWLIPGGL